MIRWYIHIFQNYEVINCCKWWKINFLSIPIFSSPLPQTTSRQFSIHPFRNSSSFQCIGIYILFTYLCTFMAHNSHTINLNIFIYCLFFRATSMAYGGSQARGWIRAAAAGLCHSHSNVESEARLWPKTKLTAMLPPYLTERGQGSNLWTHGY